MVNEWRSIVKAEGLRRGRHEFKTAAGHPSDTECVQVQQNSGWMNSGLDFKVNTRRHPNTTIFPIQLIGTSNDNFFYV
jgi:hypothetical protein